MKLKEIIHHINFGFIIAGVFGILGFMILLFPIFFTNELIVIIPRIIGFSIFEIGLFIGGTKFSINYEKEQKELIDNE